MDDDHSHVASPQLQQRPVTNNTEVIAASNQQAPLDLLISVARQIFHIERQQIPSAQQVFSVD